MKNNLNKVHSSMTRPRWIGQDVWNSLCDHWGTQGFKKKSIQAKTNRASDCGGFGGSLHTCGSITISQHRVNLTNLNGIPPSHSDLFLHTHKRGKDKTWVDKRSEYVHEKFKRRFEELTQETTSQGTPPPNELDVWCEVAGIKRGRVYGLGMESTVLLGRPNYRGSCSSSTEWVQRHEFEEMRNERDQLREELANTNRAVEHNNHLIKQLMNNLNFKPMSYTRDFDIGDHDAGDFDDEIGDNDVRYHDDEELDRDKLI
ncbi:uncharacterized protein [Cicer arietinum]|uniref:uncharacterized protein n=1 Tax=Cicer arietinum TaxID=3827 RepID=UPI0006414E11